MINREEISLREIKGSEFEEYRYAPKKVRRGKKFYKWAYAEIIEPIEYGSFEELLEDVVQTMFVRKVGILSYTREQRKRGTYYFVKREELNAEKITELSEVSNNRSQPNEGYLDVYLYHKEAPVKGFDYFLRFYKMADGKVTSAYLQTLGNERDLYTWYGEVYDCDRIYAALSGRPN